MKSSYLSFSFLVSMLFLTNVIPAQVPGYMGKKIILKSDIYSNIYIPSNNNTAYPIDNTPMRKNFGIEFITGRKTTLGLSYGLGSTNFNYSYEFGKIDNSYYNLYITKYFGNNISPVGTFCQFRFSYLQSEYLIRVEDRYWNDQVYVINQRKLTGSINNYYISMVFGQSGVLFNRFIWSYGFQFGYRLGSIIGGLFELEDSYHQTDVKRYVRKRNSYNELWGIHTGIGILL